MAGKTNEIVIKIEGGVGTGTAGGKGTGGGTGASLQDLENQLKATTNIFEKQKLLRKLYKETATDTGELSSKTIGWKKQLEEVNRRVRENSRVGKENQNTWRKALDSYQFKFNALGNIIASVTSTITRGFVNAIKSTINISKEFEEQMSAVRAVTQATGEDFNKLRSDAIRLGGATIFTSKEVAQLQEAYAKLGFNVSEIINATEATLDLAAATGEGLAESAKIAGSTLRAFGLNAASMTTMVDTMAKSFTSSALDLEKFRESMKFVAPVARSAGFSIEETTAILAKLADTGLYGSLAGTSLRNIMLRMVDASSKLSKEAGGAERGLDGMAKQFEAITRNGFDLTEALQLTDKRAVTAFETMSRNIPVIQEMADKLERAAGTASEMADIRMDNFAGSIEKLSGAWEALVLQVNESNSGLRRFVDWLTQVVDGIALFNTAEDSFKFEGVKRANEEFKRWNSTLDDTVDVYKAADNYISETTKTIKEQNEFIKQSEKEIERLDQLIMHTSMRRKKELKEQRKDELESLNLAKITVYEQEELARKLTAFKDDESKARKIADEEERLRELARIQREKDAAAEEYADRMKEINKFNKDRENAMNNVRKLNIQGIEDETRRTLAEERFRFNEQQKLYIDYWEKGYFPSYDEYFKAAENARKQHARNNLDIIKDEFKQRVEISDKYYESRKGQIAEKEREQWRSFSKLTKEQIDRYENDFLPDENAPSVFEQVLGGFELTSEQKTAIKKGLDEVVGLFSVIADQEKEAADLAVENSSRMVDQLQRDLEIEIALADKGFANNVSMRQAELENAKKAQEKALAQQKDALKKQQQLEKVAQGINMATAISGILKSLFTSLDPVTATVISIGATAGLLALFDQFKKDAGVAQFGEGGEIGGKKHSQGGTLIEAEQGEFVVKASQYAKNKELVNAINDGRVGQQWSALNRDLSVSLDDTNTARLMNKHFGSTTQYFDWGRIEKRGNSIKRIRYA